MQRLVCQPAIRRGFSNACRQTLRTSAVGTGIQASAPSWSRCEWDAKRAFGSERWCNRCIEESEEPAPVTSERFKDGPQLVECWENEAGAMVFQHDELEDIESCRWAIDCICQRLRQPESSLTTKQKCMALRFLMDLKAKVENLSDEGYGTCAIEVFERPWVLTCDDNIEILCLRPRPDGLLKRMTFAALSPVFAPAGALLTYCKSGSENGAAAFKWYFRAVSELPTKVRLDSSYRVEGSYSDLEAACKSSLTCNDLHRLISVQRTVPQFC